MVNFSIFCVFAILEYFLTALLINGINIVNYDYISLNYTSFRFSISKDSPTGLNIIIKIFSPVIYIVILSGILYCLDFNYLVKNIYVVTIIYFILKWIISIIVLNRYPLIDWKSEIICSFIAILLSWFVYFIFISKTTQIFISIEELRDSIWLGIITFFLSLIIKYVYNYSYLNYDREKKKIRYYIIKKYNKFQKKYNNIIKTKNKKLKLLTYSIMIYENYNRPMIIRVLEYIKFFIIGRATLGVMQVTTKKYITNEESVKIGYKIIKENYFSIRKKTFEDKLKRVVFMYNKTNKYVEEVLYIYHLLENEK